MAAEGPHPDPVQASSGRFATTHWSVVLAAGHGSEARSRQALEALCQAYWYPLYLYVRRRGYGVEDAQDLTQEFFARLLSKGHFALPDPKRGRFRSFLLTALAHFLSNTRQRQSAQKRGGGCSRVPLDLSGAEPRYSAESTAFLTPERAFEKRWALTLLEHVLSGLRAECHVNGNLKKFEALKDTLWGDKTEPGYAGLGRRWGMSESAVKAAAYRLRRRYRELLQAEIAQTVADPSEIEQECRDLLAAVSA